MCLLLQMNIKFCYDNKAITMASSLDQNNRHIIPNQSNQLGNQQLHMHSDHKTHLLYIYSHDTQYWSNGM